MKYKFKEKGFVNPQVLKYLMGLSHREKMTFTHAKKYFSKAVVSTLNFLYFPGPLFRPENYSKIVKFKKCTPCITFIFSKSIKNT